MSSEWKSIASCPADEIVHMVDHKVGNKPFLGYGSAGLFLTRKGSNWTTAERPPTHWMPILMPDPPADFPLSDESPGPREKPGGELHWNNLSTCPVDEEVWLIDHVDTGPYVGKILKPSAHRASFTNVPLFCALEDRDDHPNPVMWAKKNNDLDEQHRKHDELYYLEKIQGDIKCIAGALELQSERLARMEKWLSTLRAQSFTAGKDHLPR